jgi:hypothetical protein
VDLAAKITAGVAVAVALGIMVWGAWPPVKVLTIVVGLWMLYTTW